jgi:hypothetical protein
MDIFVITAMMVLAVIVLVVVYVLFIPIVVFSTLIAIIYCINQFIPESATQ